MVDPFVDDFPFDFGPTTEVLGVDPDPFHDEHDDEPDDEYWAQEAQVGDWDGDAERYLELNAYDHEAQEDLRFHEYLHPYGYGR